MIVVLLAAAACRILGSVVVPFPMMQGFRCIINENKTVENSFSCLLVLFASKNLVIVLFRTFCLSLVLQERPFSRHLEGANPSFQIE